MRKFMLFAFTFLFMGSSVDAVSNWAREYELDNGMRISRKPAGVHMKSRNADIFGGRGVFWNGSNLSMDMEEPAFRREVSKLGKIKTKPNTLRGRPAGVMRKSPTRKGPAPVARKRPAHNVNKRSAPVAARKRPIHNVNKRPAPVARKRSAHNVTKRPVPARDVKRPSRSLNKRQFHRTRIRSARRR